jgi:hypothetical protein
MIDLCSAHQIQAKDLVLERILWRGEYCGFSMLQLEFRGGVKSPQFAVKSNDSDNESSCDENVHSSEINRPTQVKHVRIRVCEDKFVERFELLAKREDVQQSDVLCKAHACYHGENFVWDLP